jgi:hypothetical protein
MNIQPESNYSIDSSFNSSLSSSFSEQNVSSRLMRISQVTTKLLDGVLLDSSHSSVFSERSDDSGLLGNNKASDESGFSLETLLRRQSERRRHPSSRQADPKNKTILSSSQNWAVMPCLSKEDKGLTSTGKVDLQFD